MHTFQAYVELFAHLMFICFLQVMRDLGFMLPDLMNVWFSWLELREVARMRGGIVPRPSHLVATRDVIIAVFSVFALWIFSTTILRNDD